MSLMMLDLNCSTKVSEKLTWQNPERLFVAQELIEMLNISDKEFWYLYIMTSKNNKVNVIPNNFWEKHDKNETPITWMFWRLFIKHKKKTCILIAFITFISDIYLVLCLYYGDEIEVEWLVYSLLICPYITIELKSNYIFNYLYKKEFYLNHYYDNELS